MPRAQSYNLPFPSGGWNARDPLDQMDPLDAIELENVIPRGGYGEVIPGETTFSTGVSASSATAIESLIPFTKADGTESLLAAAAGANILYSVASNGSVTSILTTATNMRYQWAVFKNVLILVNGTNRPRQWDGSALAFANYSGTGLTDDDLLADVCVYKSRLYFLEKDTAAFYYGGVGNIDGTVTKFDTSDVLRRGGSLTWIASWSQDTGVGLQDYLVLCSSEGEILVYGGDDPGTVWQLYARAFVGKPLGRRSKKNIGGDLWFLTEEGLLTLSMVLRGQTQALYYDAVTSKIQNAYREYVRDYGDEFGWEIFQDSKRGLVWVNVPSGEGTEVQLAMNTQTRAWCKLTRYPGICWAMFEGKVLFGDRLNAFIAEAFNTDEGDDINSTIAVVRTAFNYLRDRTKAKRITMAKIILSDLDIGEAGGGSVQGSVNVFAHCDVDFEQTTSFSAVAEYEDSTTSYVSEWALVGNYGHAASLYVRLGCINSDCKMNGFQLLYEPAAEPF